MKRTIALTLIVLVALAATGCSNLSATTTTPEENQLPARFVVLDDEALGDYQSAIQVHNDNTSERNKDVTTPVRYDDMKYVVDRVTRVVYIFLDDTYTRYSGMIMTPLYNADGTVMTYEGELPQVLYNNN